MKKRILALLIAFVVFGGTMGAYAIWDNLTQTESEIVTVGEGTNLTVAANVTAPAGKVLVPAGVVLKAEDVESITLTYDVVLDQTALTGLDLSVVASNVEINGSTTYASLVNIAISQSSATVNDANVTVTVVITLTEPSTQAEYDAIVNQPISFDLTFTATQQ
jgi:hypothetical protein